jgi:hypothetical protein
MDCSKCQGDNRKGARFCRHCGADLAESPLTENDVNQAKDAVLDELPDETEIPVSAEAGTGSEPSAESAPLEDARQPESEYELKVLASMEKEDEDVAHKDLEPKGDPVTAKGVTASDKVEADDGLPADEVEEEALPDLPEALDEQVQAQGSEPVPGTEQGTGQKPPWPRSSRPLLWR